MNVIHEWPAPGTARVAPSPRIQRAGPRPGSPLGDVQEGEAHLVVGALAPGHPGGPRACAQRGLHGLSTGLAHSSAALKGLPSKKSR